MKFQRCYNGGAVTCRAEDCTITFIPRQTGGNPQVYCSTTCRVRQQARDRFRSDPDGVRGANLKSYYKHRDRLLPIRREKGDTRKHRYTNPEYRKSAKFRQRRYILRKRVSTATPITVAEWELIKRIHQGRCYYCRKHEDLTQDHYIPISKGGTDDFDNIVPACSRCNKRKGTKSAEEFIAQLLREETA